MAKQKLIIGTRGSKLALWQAERAKTLILAKNPDLEIDVKIVKTKGDKITDVALSKIGDEGLFTKAIEDELIAKNIDVGVHSCKDMPTRLSDGLEIAAFPERDDPRDALLSVRATKLYEVDMGGVIGTSSLRRKAFLKRIRPDLKFVDLRGNVDTRLEKLKDCTMEGILMAYAAVKRMNITVELAEVFEVDNFLPAVGQGALALEMRVGDEKQQFVKKIDNGDVRLCVEAERAILAKLEGGCQIPIGCYARIKDGNLHISTAIASYEGDEYIERSVSGYPLKSEELVKQITQTIVEEGGNEILDKIRNKK